MNIVSIINYKGGVGKTTISSNLAAELAYRGKKVLILDMDPQSSLTFSFVSPDYWRKHLKSKSIKNWFDCIRQNVPPIPLEELIFAPRDVNKIVNKNGGQLDVIASNLELINVDLDLAYLLGSTHLDYISVYGTLREELQNLMRDFKYDTVLIDCPPNFNIVTKNAIIASDQILIPSKADYLSILGIDYLCKSVEGLVIEYNNYAESNGVGAIYPAFLGILFTMVQQKFARPLATQRGYMKKTKQLNIPIFKSYIRQNNAVHAEAPEKNVPICISPSYKFGNYVSVKELKNFVTELEKKQKELAIELMEYSVVEDAY